VLWYCASVRCFSSSSASSTITTSLPSSVIQYPTALYPFQNVASNELKHLTLAQYHNFNAFRQKRRPQKAQEYPLWWNIIICSRKDAFVVKLTPQHSKTLSHA
jgi:hypothetical protein